MGRWGRRRRIIIVMLRLPLDLRGMMMTLGVGDSKTIEDQRDVIRVSIMQHRTIVVVGERHLDERISRMTILIARQMLYIKEGAVIAGDIVGIDRLS